MPHVTRGDGVAATPRRAHGTHKGEVDQLTEGVLLAVEPAVMVHPLAQQLDGRLGAVHLECGHVEIVHKNDGTLAEGWPKDALAPLVHF
eukprot:scaffold3166_cov111-Isochrysis_galbana.AAC.7